MNYQLHNFATRPTLIRDAVEAWSPWMEAKLGFRLSDAVILQTRHNMAQIGVEAVLGVQQNGAGFSKITRCLKSFLISAEVAPAMPSLLGYSRPEPSLRFSAIFENAQSKPRRSRLDWQDCPVLLRLHTILDQVVALNIFYQSGPHSDSESEARILVATRRSVEQVIQLLELLDARSTTPTLTMYRSEPRAILPVSWDDLVLSPSVLSLPKNDFESFWNREQWFRERCLPFRRGFLLYGSPGNGKSTAIRAMMTSRSLSAFGIRLFQPHTTDEDLEALFEEALSRRPAMIVIEDIDRAFPRDGEKQCQVSLQALLNMLDGVSTGEGLVITATANEPAALDPAILRRPGRFDRLVRFTNPTRDLRERYLMKMKLKLEPAALCQAVANSRGFSFAQLREAVILAAQFSDERQSEVTPDDLLRSVAALRETMVRGSRHSNRAGFVPEEAEDEEAA